MISAPEASVFVLNKRFNDPSIGIDFSQIGTKFLTLFSPFLFKVNVSCIFFHLAHL